MHQPSCSSHTPRRDAEPCCWVGCYWVLYLGLTAARSSCIISVLYDSCARSVRRFPINYVLSVLQHAARFPKLTSQLPSPYSATGICCKSRRDIWDLSWVDLNDVGDSEPPMNITSMIGRVPRRRKKKPTVRRDNNRRLSDLSTEEGRAAHLGCLPSGLTCKSFFLRGVTTTQSLHRRSVVKPLRATWFPFSPEQCFGYYPCLGWPDQELIPNRLESDNRQAAHWR